MKYLAQFKSEYPKYIDVGFIKRKITDNLKVKQYLPGMFYLHVNSNQKKALTTISKCSSLCVKIAISEKSL